MSIKVTRRLEFDAGHRLVGHESKCANLHGHRYTLEATAMSLSLDAVGRVVDFSVIKGRLGAWVDDNWDHTFIVYKDDPDLALLQKCQGNRPLFIAPFNPTAENMAMYLLYIVAPTLFEPLGIIVTDLTLRETPNCWATISLRPQFVEERLAEYGAAESGGKK